MLTYMHLLTLNLFDLQMYICVHVSMGRSRKWSKEGVRPEMAPFRMGADPKNDHLKMKSSNKEGCNSHPGQ